MSGKIDLLREIELDSVDQGLAIWFLGGPSIVVKSAHALVYVDLFSGPSPVPELTKAIPDVINPNNIARVDAALCTHFDVDHCHHDSLAPVYANTKALMMGPISCTDLFRKWGFSSERIVEMAPHQGFQVGDMRIWGFPSNDHSDPDALTYVIQAGGVTIFESGDTLFFSGYRDIGGRFQIDAALLNFAKNPPHDIWYMNARHTARVGEMLNPRYLIPKHFDLWAEFKDDPYQLEPLLESSGIELVVLGQGERFLIDPLDVPAWGS